MIEEIFNNGNWLVYTFAFLIGLSMLLYAILDGYDLGVGMLSRNVTKDERDRMIASVGPFWDANETWLVLGVGLLLVAFPAAHGIVLSNLYLPVTLMLVGLILRGVSFDFRKKVPDPQQAFWNQCFFWSSLLVALTQGYMVGRFVTGFHEGVWALAFAVSFAFLVVSGYLLMGATWLIIKTEDELQIKAIRWAYLGLAGMVVAAVVSTAIAPWVNTRIYDKMFAFPEIILLLAMPIASVFFTALIVVLLRALPLPDDRLAGLPFAISILIFALGFNGLVYSFYPYIIPGHLKIVDAAASPESLLIILIGTAIVLPFLIGYTAFAYWIFRGKARELNYD